MTIAPCLRERDGRLAAAAAEVEDPLALDLADQAQLALGRSVGPVEGDVGGVVGEVTCSDAVPDLDVHRWIIARNVASYPPLANRSTNSRASSSWYCSAGDFMK